MEVLKVLMDFAIVFVVGGFVCLLAQVLIIKTKLTPARILVIFLLLGILLQTVGAFKYMKEFAQSGVTIPILGFGASLAKGAIEWVEKVGPLGAIAGGLINTAFGIGMAILMSYFVTLVFSPKTK